MSFRFRHQGVEPVLVLRDRVEGEKELGIISQVDAGGKDVADMAFALLQTGQGGGRVAPGEDGHKDAGRFEVGGHFDSGHGQESGPEVLELADEEPAELGLDQAGDTLGPDTGLGHVLLAQK